MGLNETPAGERVHIGFFGKRNAGKSSLVNAVTAQEVSVVSEVAGTTTDPVRKTMELLPIGPVVMVDTPGIDDEGALGAQRVQRARRALEGIDLAVLVVDAADGVSQDDRELAQLVAQARVPWVVAWSKADRLAEGGAPDSEGFGSGFSPDAMVLTSAITGEGVVGLKETLGQVWAAHARERQERHLIADLLKPGDVVVLVVPIDSAAPKGRLILPQQQVIRDIVEAGAVATVSGVEALTATLAMLAELPRMVVCDSQAFEQVARIVPDEIELTSFSILMARYKGTLPAQVQAVEALGTLKDDDVVLISEGCTHHRQCEDIGTVKLPALIRQICGAQPRFESTSGGSFPDDVSGYAVVVHCGGCMLNAREMASRAARAARQGVPFTNYGMTIAKAHGVFARALAPLA